MTVKAIEAAATAIAIVVIIVIMTIVAIMTVFVQRSSENLINKLVEFCV